MGGAGLLEVSQIYVKSPTGIFYPEWEYDNKKTWPMVNSPEIVPGLKKLAGAIHEFDSRIFMEVSAWTFLYGPVSSVPFETGVHLNELTHSDIREIQEGFALAAKHVMDGDFDGVDLHGTHGAMIEHFYSPAMNRRSDRYGGSLENRLRFLFEVIDATRGVIGDSLALGMRLCADEQIEGGVTPEYAAKIAAELDGHLDFINVDRGSIYNYDVLDQNALQTEPLVFPHGVRHVHVRTCKARGEKNADRPRGADHRSRDCGIDPGSRAGRLPGDDAGPHRRSLPSEEGARRKAGGDPPVHRDARGVLGAICGARLSHALLGERGRGAGRFPRARGNLDAHKRKRRSS